MLATGAEMSFGVGTRVTHAGRGGNRRRRVGRDGFTPIALSAILACLAGFGCSSDDNSSGTCESDHGECLDKSGGDPVAECKSLSSSDEVAHGYPFQSTIRLGDGDEFGEIRARFTVPPKPALACGNQVLYYYVGFQAPLTSDLVQPILAYGKDWGGWFIMSEDCCEPKAKTSERISVDPGDIIDAGIVKDGDEYIITIARGSDVTTVTGSATKGTFDTAVATLEVYALENCGELPNVNFEFEILTLTDDEGNDVAQDWSVNQGSDICEVELTVQ